ncbi:MAG: hypothetical protein ACR2J8_15795, partial [Thermomicrobiales bacterium]
MRAFVVRVILLTAVYLLVLSSRDWRDAVVGAVLASAMLVGTRAFRQTDRLYPLHFRFGRLVAFFP